MVPPSIGSLNYKPPKGPNCLSIPSGLNAWTAISGIRSITCGRKRAPSRNQPIRSTRPPPPASPTRPPPPTPPPRQTPPAERPGASIHRPIPSSLNLTEPAVSHEIDPRTIAALLRGKEIDRRGHLLRIPDPAHRHHLRELRPDGIPLCLGLELRIDDRRLHRSRAQAVDPDPPLLELGRPAPRERPHRRLGCRIHAVERETLKLHRRGYQHYRTSVPQKRQGLVGAEEYPPHIDIEDLVEMLGRRGGQRRHLDDPRIDHQDIDPPAFGLHRCIQPVQVRQARDIPLHRAHIPANLLFRLFQLRRTAAGNEYIRPLFDESLCRSQPDAAASAGNDGCLVL